MLRMKTFVSLNPKRQNFLPLTVASCGVIVSFQDEKPWMYVYLVAKKILSVW